MYMNICSLKYKNQDKRMGFRPHLIRIDQNLIITDRYRSQMLAGARKCSEMGAAGQSLPITSRRYVLATCS